MGLTLEDADRLGRTFSPCQCSEHRPVAVDQSRCFTHRGDRTVERGRSRRCVDPDARGEVVGVHEEFHDPGGQIGR